ncbi:LysR family transcriptional regulator [Collimonas pratensis]|uniref:Bacterial regulatory helix-turn-helix, lysR family protein n=1 Tax=Collimonas pratensis TaxID=279113 RepID=A0A127Q652_9BURK|nr:LysR family transcriptional regulator [Collimonas pratensis]AMP05501.1 bacterial regulatory helix-turn-helix, lysR family protein [Collimonas pratensis]AMP14472.1 bacterial regulatory helix-turn-helix, lysR family protein [Collimonas pratensis]NKI69140.1 LysR family transcriptional regulator [Collimonas pratensis]
MDRLQSMRVFAKVVEQGSFVAAAQVLDMSNAVVTRLVADLENHLGIRLLHRSTRRMALTEPGQAYLERVRQILDEIDEAEAAASVLSTKPAGTLHIYSQIGFGQTQLARLLPLYSKQYPDVQLDVTLSDRTADLIEEGFDVGIFSVNQKFDVSMVARQLGIAEVLLCASPAYIAEHGAPQAPEDLARHACLNFSLEHLRHHWTFQSTEGTSVIPIASKVMSNNTELLRHCLLAGMGIAMRSSYTLGDDMAAGRVVRVLPEHQINKVAVRLVYPSRRLLSAKVRSFVDFMMAQFPHPDCDPWLVS